MNSPNAKTTAQTDDAAAEKAEEELRALLTVYLDGEDEKRQQTVDEFSDEFLLQATPRPPK